MTEWRTQNDRVEDSEWQGGMAVKTERNRSGKFSDGTTSSGGAKANHPLNAGKVRENLNSSGRENALY